MVLRMASTVPGEMSVNVRLSCLKMAHCRFQYTSKAIAQIFNDNNPHTYDLKRTRLHTSEQGLKPSVQDPVTFLCHQLSDRLSNT
ncbi:hypothetical protein AVEN_270893-1 [Araneus ventricosus]|uniref:Uncharacterized protein n=1 Tax=Araneus ventricosus TaxID=182803 RepID=A0A4Y2T5D6_ARAVE|nr:hypothetical protein AVEN_270893-1 [Araneus ventricosus]